MRYIDVFNGDADGLCALHQLRLADPRTATLVTGVKRDTALLRRVSVGENENVLITVLDVSLDRNRADLERLLQTGARVRYFDHHFAGTIPSHPHLDAHIDTAANTCTSAIVDAFIGGVARPWAIVAAFGDNLAATAHRLAASIDVATQARESLRELGEALNYNAYGESIDDLLIDPVALYRRIEPCADPLEFFAADPIVPTLREARAHDLAAAWAIDPLDRSPDYTIVMLPPAPWSRRVLGTFAHERSTRDPRRAHAVLAPTADGVDYAVSVRTPEHGTIGADRLCRAYPSGGGRTRAAGIDRLPPAKLEQFFGDFRAWSVSAR